MVLVSVVGLLKMNLFQLIDRITTLPHRQSQPHRPRIKQASTLKSRDASSASGGGCHTERVTNVIELRRGNGYD